MCLLLNSEKTNLHFILLSTMCKLSTRLRFHFCCTWRPRTNFLLQFLVYFQLHFTNISDESEEPVACQRTLLLHVLHHLLHSTGGTDGSNMRRVACDHSALRHTVAPWLASSLNFSGPHIVILSFVRTVQHMRKLRLWQNGLGSVNSTEHRHVCWLHSFLHRHHTGHVEDR